MLSNDDARSCSSLAGQSSPSTRDDVRSQAVELCLVLGLELAEERMDAVVLDVGLERVDEQRPDDLVPVGLGEHAGV